MHTEERMSCTCGAADGNLHKDFCGVQGGLCKVFCSTPAPSLRPVPGVVIEVQGNAPSATGRGERLIWDRSSCSASATDGLMLRSQRTHDGPADLYAALSGTPAGEDTDAP